MADMFLMMKSHFPKASLSSPVGAIQHIREITQDAESANSSIFMITGITTAIEGPKAIYTLCYLADAVVKANNDGSLSTLTPNGALKEAQRRADAHLTRLNGGDLSWVIPAGTTRAEVDEDGNIVARERTGTKKEKATQIFNEMGASNRDKILKAFVDELQMSKAGAMSYFYQIAKENGITTNRKKSGPTKRERAEALYKKHGNKLDKEGYVELFQKELDMTPAGALSYFYAVRK